MKELKALLEGAGFESVETYIQSGNIVLRSAKPPEDKISELILSNFGFKSGVVALTEDEFNAAVSNNPYQGFEGKFVHFFFCKESPKLDPAKLDIIASPSESYKQVGNVFYLHAPDGIGRSKLVKNIESCLGVTATGRNLNTIEKLIEMVKNS